VKTGGTSSKTGWLTIRRRGIAAAAVFVAGVVLGCAPRIEVPRIEEPTLAVGGDVSLGRRQNAITAAQGPAAALAGVSALRSADLAYVNLESVVASGGVSGVEKGEDGPFYFRGRPEMLAVLSAAGIDVVGLANNHTGDYGPPAIVEELELLEAMNLGFTGAGRNFDEACAPVFRRARDLTLAFFAIDSTNRHFAAAKDRPGTCHLDPEDPEAWTRHLTSRIAKARGFADLVLVGVHWGGNYKARPSERTRRLARAIVDADADAVLGSSAHLVQGVEIYRGRPILYDTGNLLFDIRAGDASARSGLFRLVLGPYGVEQIRMLPLEVGYGWTRHDASRNAAETLSDLQELSREFGTPVKIQTGEAIIELPKPPVRPKPSGEAPAVPPVGAPPRPASAPPAACVVARVPASASSWTVA
jgi:poly-gamma-glutamate capsule biosynthesis protein CapA/YwtB (metallophosphatase superfamily)